MDFFFAKVASTDAFIRYSLPAHLLLARAQQAAISPALTFRRTGER